MQPRLMMRYHMSKDSNHYKGGKIYLGLYYDIASYFVVIYMSQYVK